MASSSSSSSPTAVLTPRAAVRILGLPWSALHLEAVEGNNKPQCTRRLKKAFVEATLKCHPDLFPDDPMSTQRFRELTDALRVALEYVERGASGDDDEETRTAASTATRSSSATDRSAWRTLDKLQHRVAEYHALLRHTPPCETPSCATDGAASAVMRPITEICRRENLAASRLWQLTHDLPTLLCGRDAALFDVFCFHPPRCAERLEPLAMRLAEHLPTLVHDVVFHRRHRIRTGFSKKDEWELFGFGATSNGSHHQARRIEDMNMKPLVLLGCLILVERPHMIPMFQLLGSEGSAKRAASSPDDAACGGADDDAQDAYGMSATESRDMDREAGLIACGRGGVKSGTDIACCRELRCVITGDDTLQDMVRKFGEWEAASFDRLRLEMSLASRIQLLSSMLQLPVGASDSDDGSVAEDRSCALTLPADLTMSMEDMRPVALTIHRLMCTLSLMSDLADDGVALLPNENDPLLPTARLRTAVDAVASLAVEAVPYVRGGIQLLIPSGAAERAKCLAQHRSDVCSPSMDGHPEVTFETEGRSCPSSAEGDSQGDSEIPKKDLRPPHRVVRHPSACDIADVQFGVTVELHQCADVLVKRIHDALNQVMTLVKASQDVMPHALELRRRLAADEFTVEKVEIKPGVQADDLSVPPPQAVLSKATDDAAAKPQCEPCDEAPSLEHSLSASAASFDVGDFGDFFSATATTNPTISQSHSFPRRIHQRHGIQCVARVLNMLAPEEVLLWERLDEMRDLVAEKQGVASPMNVFYQCRPYDLQGGRGRDVRQAADEAQVSWDASSAGGWCGEGSDGVDSVLLTRRELDDPSAFRGWLEDVLEQSSLARAARTLMQSEGIDFVERHPNLPVAHFLSFLHVFVSPAGAAARQALLHTGGGARMGFVMVVTPGTCDVREGGRLMVPWYFDPSQLIAALESAGGSDGTRYLQD